MKNNKSALRKEYAKKRINLLAQQDVLHIKHCEPCPESNDRTGKREACESCSVFQQLNDIGKQLDNISIDKRVQSGLREKEAKEKMDNETKVIKYKELKAKGFTDTEIAIELNIPKGSFSKWKSRNGITTTQYRTQTRVEQKDKVLAEVSSIVEDDKLGEELQQAGQTIKEHEVKECHMINEDESAALKSRINILESTLVNVAIKVFNS
ncbi:hypothetical protein [Viridibacillus arvi]|uniref:hypothetical protein n=1 Tax=Viridibacillus arvi TaxID=263475 RepID=UPI003D29AB75